mgnify:CR=1 FL=1
MLPPQETLCAVEDFYGTNYSITKLATTVPDTPYYYDFDNELLIYEQQSDGTTNLVRQGGIMDEEKPSTHDKYAAFLVGNNGYSELSGHGEGSVLVIKDSYGNSLIPYLTQSYAKIGILDLRAWNTSLITLDSLYEQGGYERMLVLYNFPTFSADMFAYRMMDAANNAG